jgi:hypothetical protein
MAGVFQPDVFQPDVFQVALSFSGAGTTTQAVQSEAAQGLERFIATVADSQAAQTAAAAGRLDFVATGATSQAPQGEAVAAIEDFISVTGVTTQAVQSAIAFGVLDDVGAGATSQASQTSADAGALRFLSSAASAQVPQSLEGTGTTPVFFAGDGASSQARQTAAATGVTDSVAPVSAGGSVARRRRQRVDNRPPWPLELLRPPAIAATGATRQGAQQARGRGLASDPDEWLLLDLEVAA